MPTCVYFAAENICLYFDATSADGSFCDGLNENKCGLKESKGCTWDTDIPGGACSYIQVDINTECSPGCTTLGDGVCDAECNTPTCREDAGDCCERPTTTEGTSNILRFNVTVQNQPTTVPPVFFDDSRHRQRELIPRVELIGGMIINQVRGQVGTCPGFRTMFKPSASKANKTQREATSDLAGHSFFYDKVKDGCRDAREAMPDPYGYDPVLLKESPLYDADVNIDEHYNTSDLGTVRAGGGMPYGFFSRQNAQNDSIFSVFLDPNLRNQRALEFVRAMSSGGFIDKDTLEVLVGIPAFSKEAGLFIMLDLTFTWDEFGLIQPSIELNGFQPIEPERNRTTTGLIILFLVCLFINFVLELMELQSLGIKHYCTCGNFVDLLSMGIFVGIFVMWFVLREKCLNFSAEPRYPVYEDYLSEARFLKFKDNGAVLDQFLGMFNEAEGIIKLHLNIKSSMVTAICLLVVRIIMSLDFHPKVGLVSRTLKRAANDLAHFVFLFGIIFTVYSASAYFIIGHIIEEFSTFDKTLQALFTLLLGEMGPWNAVIEGVGYFSTR
jgi:hypothetical protein